MAKNEKKPSGGNKAVYDDYVKRTEELLEPIMKENVFELVDVEYVKEGGEWRLRIFLDKEGGITISDCEKVNRQLSDILDKEDFILDSYILEVSSPGLGRQLKKEKDFQRSIGKDVEVKLYQSINFLEKGKTIKAKEFVGKLVEADEEAIVLEFEKEEKLQLLRKDIAKISLAIDF